MKSVLVILSIFSLQYLLATETINQEKVISNHQLINILMGEEIFIEKTIPENRSARPTREVRITRETRTGRDPQLARSSRVSRSIHLVQKSQPKKKSSLNASKNTKTSNIQLAKKK